MNVRGRDRWAEGMSRMSSGSVTMARAVNRAGRPAAKPRPGPPRIHPSPIPHARATVVGKDKELSPGDRPPVGARSGDINIILDSYQSYSPSLPIASTGHSSIAARQAASCAGSSGWWKT